ncbi:hypothetical protein KUA55_18015 [Enterococcus sp. ALS3]|uniref:WxL domain-containing protein n=1 Tax=Enterococcus alishanensis TaxID=1303817 RepID=A0ABS6TI46_9ENTE|nr:hypothetical protein [Enterococcus alishanensis]MBV7392545.1 hypothetical protein [Enterococcus alishanensis]
MSSIKKYTANLLFFLGLIFFFFLTANPIKSQAASPPNGYTLYTVSNYAQFKAAMNAPSTLKKYILLNNDIVYGFSNGATTTSTTSAIDVLSYTSDTIIDGSGTSGTARYSLLFGYIGNTNAYSYDSPLRTITPNITVTFQNLNVGNSTCRNFTNGGLVYPYTNQGTNINLNVIVNNVTYNIQGFNGTPFNSFYADNSTITFKGTNTFTSSNTSSGAYFSSGFSNLNFDTDSSTIISVAGAGTSEVMSGNQDTGTLNITLNPRANVTVNNGKTTFIRSDNATLNVGDSAKLNYNLVNGSGSTTSGVLNSRGSTVINATNNSTLNFSSSKSGVTSWGLTGSNTINANAPKEILFATSATTPSPLFTGSVMTVNRNDQINTCDYQSSTLEIGETIGTNYLKYKIGDSNSLSSENTASKTAWVYEPTASISSVTANSIVANRQSDLNINDIVLNDDNSTIQQVSYKIADAPLVSDDITLDSSQKTISDKESESLIASNSSSSETFTINNLLAQMYYIYSQVLSIRNHNTVAGNFTTETLSKWTENSSAVPEYKSMSIINNIDFHAFRSKISKTDNLNPEDYQTINNGNTIRKLSLNSLTVNSGSASDVTLVDQLTEGKNSQLALSLVAQKNDSQDIVKWGPLLANKGSTDNLSLAPYWQTDHSANLYVTGNFSGPYDVLKDVSYTLHFDIATVTS